MRTAPPHTPKSDSDKRRNATERPFSILDIDDDDLEPAIKDIGVAIERDRRGSLEASYKIGLVIDEHYRRLEKINGGANWPARGDRFFEQLADALDRNAGWLRDHFRLVRTYNEEEFEELCQTPDMTATKAIRLTGLDAELRAKLVEKVANEGLTVRGLDAAIKEEVGPRRKPRTGRQVKRPKKLSDAMVHLRSQADKFVKLEQDYWFGDNYDIINELKELPASSLTKKLREQIVDAAEKCDEVVSTATKDAKALRSTLPEIDRRMEAQAKVAAQAEENERRFNEEELA